MKACRELSKLPKTTALRSLNFKRTTPGAVGPMLGNNRATLHGPLDPAHPAARVRQEVIYRTFPHYTAPGFTLRLFPRAILHIPDATWPDPPFSPARARGPGSRRVDVSFVKVIGKKSVHKSSVVRGRIGSKLKTALALIVTRGADAEAGRLVFREEDIGQEQWLCQEWTYAAIPTLEVYRMPFAAIVPEMRKALVALKKRADLLALGWKHERGVIEAKRRASRLRQQKILGGQQLPDLKHAQPRTPKQPGSSVYGLAIDRHKDPIAEISVSNEEKKEKSWFFVKDNPQTDMGRPSLPSQDTDPLQEKMQGFLRWSDSLGEEPDATDPSEPSVLARDATKQEPFFPHRFTAGRSGTPSLLSRLEEIMRDEQDVLPTRLSSSSSVSEQLASPSPPTGPPASSTPTFTSKLRPFISPKRVPQQQEPETAKSRIAGQLFRRPVAKPPEKLFSPRSLRKDK
ncbi:hypothetical protein B0H21DRAFT_821527 [Amylocystis lapponica]|nr:hypothetical protein B0H21DRAFT_821527 [Amylocystis lapponica]